MAVLINFTLVWRLWSNLESGLTALTFSGRDLANTTPSWAGVKDFAMKSLTDNLAGDAPTLTAVEPILDLAESLGLDHVAFVRRALSA